MGRRGTYLNTSIPGTGIYNRQKLSNGTQKTLVGSSAPDNTRKEQKNDEKDWLKIFLKVLLAVNLLAFIGGIILYVDNKETFSPMELFSMIFCAIISVACIIGLRELRKKALRDLGRKMGKDIVEQLLEKVEVDKKANEKKNL